MATVPTWSCHRLHLHRPHRMVWVHLHPFWGRRRGGAGGYTGGSQEMGVAAEAKFRASPGPPRQLNRLCLCRLLHPAGFGLRSQSPVPPSPGKFSFPSSSPILHGQFPGYGCHGNCLLAPGSSSADSPSSPGPRQPSLTHRQGTRPQLSCPVVPSPSGRRLPKARAMLPQRTLLAGAWVSGAASVPCRRDVRQGFRGPGLQRRPGHLLYPGVAQGARL